MSVLLLFMFIALGFSFLCSIAEAVMLSVTPAYIELLRQEGHLAGDLLFKLKANINRALAAILTLNTIAHTMGAAGVGAQAAIVFGDAYVGLISAILTLLILIFSEIIPKILGAHYWRKLAPATAYGLRILIVLLHPFVILSEKLVQGLPNTKHKSGFSRSEFAAMAKLSFSEGQLAERESNILTNLLHLQETQIRDVMTPCTVLFSLADNLLVDEFFHKYNHIRFSRIPIFDGNNPEHMLGFVLRSDLLLAQARGNGGHPLNDYCREMGVLSKTDYLSEAFDVFLQRRAQIILILGEYGEIAGILTLEDLFETLLGLEIVDENDKNVDMRKLARRLWKRRAKKMGLEID